MQELLDVAGGSIYDNAVRTKKKNPRGNSGGFFPNQIENES
jgi:hypothetical protein